MVSYTLYSRNMAKYDLLICIGMDRATAEGVEKKMQKNLLSVEQRISELKKCEYCKGNKCHSVL